MTINCVVVREDGEEFDFGGEACFAWLKRCPKAQPVKEIRYYVDFHPKLTKGQFDLVIDAGSALIPGFPHVSMQNCWKHGIPIKVTENTKINDLNLILRFLRALTESNSFLSSWYSLSVSFKNNCGYRYNRHGYNMQKYFPKDKNLDRVQYALPLVAASIVDVTEGNISNIKRCYVHHLLEEGLTDYSVFQILNYKNSERRNSLKLFKEASMYSKVESTFHKSSFHGATQLFGERILQRIDMLGKKHHFYCRDIPVLIACCGPWYNDMINKSFPKKSKVKIIDEEDFSQLDEIFNHEDDEQIED